MARTKPAKKKTYASLMAFVTEVSDPVSQIRRLLRNATPSILYQFLCKHASKFYFIKDVLPLSYPGIMMDRYGKTEFPSIHTHGHYLYAVLVWPGGTDESVHIAIQPAGLLSLLKKREHLETFYELVLKQLITLPPKPVPMSVYNGISAVVSDTSTPSQIRDAHRLWLERAEMRVSDQKGWFRKNVEQCEFPGELSRIIDSIDSFVDRLIESGWNQEQAAEEILEIMQIHVDAPPHIMYVLTAADCFVKSRARLGDQALAFLRDSYCPRVIEQLVSSVDPPSRISLYAMHRLGKFGMWGLCKGARYREMLSDMMAAGYLNRAYQLLLLFAMDWDLIEISPNLNSEGYKHNIAQILRSLIPNAFMKAFESQRYGIAAFLVEQFGRNACLDQGADPEDTTADELRNRYPGVDAAPIVDEIMHRLPQKLSLDGPMPMSGRDAADIDPEVSREIALQLSRKLHEKVVAEESRAVAISMAHIYATLNQQRIAIADPMLLLDMSVLQED